MVQTLDFPLLQIKVDSAARTFSGYGSTFGNKDYANDVIAPGAFTASLAKHARDGTKPCMFWAHKSDQVPGVWRDIREDRVGLRVQGQLLDTTLGREVHVLLKEGAVRGLSIGFRVEKDDYNADGSRTLKQVDLAEISVVSLPCNPEAQIGDVKFQELAERLNSITAFERACRDKFGASRSQAKQLAREWWPGFRRVAHGENAIDSILAELQDAHTLDLFRSAATTIRNL